MADYQPSLTAAIQIGKKMHTGRYHRDIYAKLTPEERAQAGTDGRQFGFVDEAGKYLHRATAMQYARDMGLLHPQHVNTKSPHLIAEMLADRPQRKRGGAARRGDGGGAWDAEWELPDDILPPPKAKRAPKAKKDEPLGMEHDDPRRAQNLMEWFGNSVLHDNGVPRTYYTGTSKDVDFDKFNVGRHGVWFTSDPKSASSYADENDSQGYRREGNTYVKTNTAGRVIPAHLKAENPYTGDIPDHYHQENYKRAQSAWFDHLRAKGHDSWVPASANGTLAVMLHGPHQIKSAIGNNGAFSQTDHRVHRADGGAVSVDNPGGDWLRRKQEYAEEARGKGHKVTGPITAWTKDIVHVDPAKVKFPGSLGENPMPGSAKYDALMESLRGKSEYPHDYGAVLIGVNHRGEPHILEGNHRLAVSRDIGFKHVPAEVKWYSGGEQAEGGFKPEHLHSILANRTAKADGGGFDSLHWEDEPPSAEAIANDARRQQFANPHHTPAFTPNLPHDPTSREKRATELGYTHHGFHGTRADVPAFDPRRVDVGTHIGTDEQANQRIKHTRKWNDDTAGENVIPVRAKLGKSFEMPDVGSWNDAVEVMNHMISHGARMNPGWQWPLHMTRVLGTTIDKRDEHHANWKPGDPEWTDSPENKHALSLINSHLRQNGYGSIKYHNIAENLHGAHPGMRHDIAKQYEELENQIHELYSRRPGGVPPPEVKDMETRLRDLRMDPKNHNDKHSYIVLDPAHLRSRFAQFDPARAHEPDLLAAKGGFMRKPRADGGSVNEDAKLHTGPIHSPVAGRTDHLPMHVPSGSYVIPADIIGAMGEGNTMAGFKHVRRMFAGNPYGNKPAPYSQGEKTPYGTDPDAQPYDPSAGPYQSELPGKAHGGSAANHVAIIAAGGEYVLTPDEVRMAGDGDLERGHRVLDEFIKRYRQKTIKTLQRLPGPAKD